MRLSKNFTLSEMTKSQTAIRHGIENVPGEYEIQNMIALAQNVLQPVRDHFGVVVVNSGFRCLELNRKIGSSDRSQHTKGQAADIEVYSASNLELAEWIRDNLEFDQLILEFWNSKDPHSGWVHVSFVDYELTGKRNRNECLTITREKTYYGLG